MATNNIDFSQSHLSVAISFKNRVRNEEECYGNEMNALQREQMKF